MSHPNERVPMSFLSDNEGPLRIIFGLVGTCLTAGCGFCPVMTLIEMLGEGPIEDGTFGAAFVGAVFAAVGIALLVLAFRGWGHEAKEKAKREAWQRQILTLADDRDGAITVSELAMETSYTIGEAESYLGAFVERGAATLDVNREGQKVYQFPALGERGASANSLEERIETVFEEAELSETAQPSGAHTRGSGDPTESAQRSQGDEVDERVLDDATESAQRSKGEEADERVLETSGSTETSTSKRSEDDSTDESRDRSASSSQPSPPEDADKTQQMFAADFYDDDERSD